MSENYHVILGKKHLHAAAGFSGGVNDDCTGDNYRYEIKFKLVKA